MLWLTTRFTPVGDDEARVGGARHSDSCSTVRKGSPERSRRFHQQASRKAPAPRDHRSAPTDQLLFLDDHAFTRVCRGELLALRWRNTNLRCQDHPHSRSPGGNQSPRYFGSSEPRRRMGSAISRRRILSSIRCENTDTGNSNFAWPSGLASYLMMLLIFPTPTATAVAADLLARLGGGRREDRHGGYDITLHALRHTYASS
jgi:integrase